MIRATAPRTNGAAGPSGIDAGGWRRLCTSFKSASSDLCHSLAATARRLCTSLVDPKSVAPLLACRLLALDKNPGVRPIAVGEIARRIIAKAVLSIIRGDIQDVAGTLQLCAGQISGTEAAVHAVRESFLREDTEAVLLVDASNAFNTLNRQTALHNIRRLCPSLSSILINCYRQSTELFVDGDVLFSEEGTTQGDPLAMPMYAVDTVPLIKRLNSQVCQVWYADDATASGTIEDLRDWWDQISKDGPAFGYHANASKTWLVTKPSFLTKATAVFSNTDVKVTSEGRPHLGAALGTREYTENYVRTKVTEWSEELVTLAIIAKTQPHSAHAAFTHGMTSKWLYLSRVTTDISQLLRPLEEIIRIQLVSLKVTEPLKDAILEYAPEYTYEILCDQLTAKADVHTSRRETSTAEANRVKQALHDNLQRAMDLATEKGASSWLTSLPIDEFGFALHKGAFHDALALRYGWQPARTPSNCTCGTKFTIEHSLSCPRGGFPTIRHNEIRDVTVNLLSEVCHDVRIEPDLQPLTGEVMSGASAITEDGARLDIAANGFWSGRFEKTFMDVRVFNRHAPSNKQTTLTSCYRKHERLKKRAYEQRVRETEHATFTPLVLSGTGGMGMEATIFYKRLASFLAMKWDQPYSTTVA